MKWWGRRPIGAARRCSRLVAVVATGRRVDVAEFSTAPPCRRPVFLWSLVAFTVASAGAAAAPNLGFLVGVRVLQGLGGGAMVPVGMAVILELFPRHRHGRAIAIWGMAAMVGPAVGPTLGGW